MESGEIRELVIQNEIWIFILIMLAVCFASYCDPSQFRASTTRLKYISGYILYSTIGIGICLFVAAFPDLVISTLAEAKTPETTAAVTIFEVWIEVLPSFAALLLALLLVRFFKPVGLWHGNLLTWIRTLVNIPVEQGLLARQLINGNYNLFHEEQTARTTPLGNVDEDSSDTTSLHDLVEETLQEDDIDKRDWIYEPSNILRYQWAKTISLFQRFERTFSDPRYRAYARLFPTRPDDHRAQFRALRKVVPPIIKRARQHLDCLPGAGVDPGTMQEQQAIRKSFDKEVRELRRKDLDKFQRDLHKDFAGIVHCCSTTAVKRKQLLARFGFEYVPGFRDIAAPLTISFIFLLIIVLGVFPQVATASFNSVEGMLRIFYSMFGAVLIALIIIESPISPSDDYNDDSVQIYQADWERVVTPAAIAFLLGIGVGLLIHYSIAYWLPLEFQSKVGFCYKQPLALIPGVTAAVLTYLMLQRAFPANRWLDAGILSVSLTATLFMMIHNIMPLVNATCPGALVLPPTRAVLVMSSLIGLFIGATIPDWARKKRGQMEEVKARDSKLDADKMAIV